MKTPSHLARHSQDLPQIYEVLAPSLIPFVIIMAETNTETLFNAM